MKKASVLVVLCLALLGSMGYAAETSNEVVVKTTEQSSTLEVGQVHVTVIVPPADGSRGAKLRLSLSTQPVQRPSETVLTVSITASQRVSLRTTPSFHITGYTVRSGTRSLFMQLSASGNRQGHVVVATLAAPAERSLILNGLSTPIVLAANVPYTFKLAESQLAPITSNVHVPQVPPRRGPSPPGLPPGTPQQTLYVSNAYAGTVTSYTLPLGPNSSVANTISTGCQLGHGMTVSAANPVADPSWAVWWPNNQLLVSEFPIQVGSQPCNQTTATVVGYGLNQTTPTLSQLPLTAGFMSTSASSTGSSCSPDISLGNVWCNNLTVASYYGIAGPGPWPPWCCPPVLYEGVNVITGAPNGGITLTGYIADFYLEFNGSPPPPPTPPPVYNAFYLPSGTFIQDVTQQWAPYGDTNIYALIGTYNPPTQPGQVFFTNAQILVWSGTQGLGPLGYYSTANPQPQPQNPTSMFAEACIFAPCVIGWGQNDLGQELFITDSGSSLTPQGTDSIFVYQRPISGPTGATEPCTITGPHTGLNQPVASATDALGNLYVANQGNSTITVYQPGSSGGYGNGCGDISPITTLSGNGLSGPISLAIAPVNVPGP
jgi:hypothetical protein